MSQPGCFHDIGNADPIETMLAQQRAAVSMICSRFSSAFSRDTLMVCSLRWSQDLRLLVLATAERSQIRKNSA
ncbi:hypothetical protein ACF1BQ_006570 [Bradyrhizobium sp. RDT10]